MQNASRPGTVRKKHVLRVEPKESKNRLPMSSDQRSSTALTMDKVIPMIGASQNMVAAGLSMPNFLSLRRTCVKAHRIPPKAVPARTRRNPERAKCVSVATIRITPAKIRVMTPTRRSENTSRRNQNANASTNNRDEDLTIARKSVSKHSVLLLE